MKLTLIGAGKLGKQLYREFVKHPSIELTQWLSRSASTSITAEGIELINATQKLRLTACYLIAVNDESIASVSSQLPTDALVIHTSGGTEIEALSRHKRRGVFYPIQSFSPERIINFSGLPIGIEASEKNDLKHLELLVKTLNAKTVYLDSKQRKAIHLAAVLVNNFTNHLFTKAAQVCRQNELPFDLLKPLIHETINKLDELSPYEAQTGPALRNDTETLKAHSKIIQNKELKSIYSLLSQTIMTHHSNEKL